MLPARSVFGGKSGTALSALVFTVQPALTLNLSSVWQFKVGWYDSCRMPVVHAGA